MPLPKPCLDCGKLTANTRCQTCAAQAARAIEARRGPRPHYAGQYRKQAKQIRDTATACYWCNQPFTPDDPCQADHLIPREPLSPLVPAHRSCNIKRSKQKTPTHQQP